MLERYGNYSLLRRIATGGMAEIFLARQEGLQGFNKEVVIKRILPALAAEPRFVRMFLDEARTAARLNHPNIAQIYNLGAQGGTYFIAMEFLDGPDVRSVWQVCESAGQPMPPQHAVRVVSEAAAALQHAHHRKDSRGSPLEIVHRDVSPQNILITKSGSVKLVDFGIAKAADSTEQTRAGVLKGKFAYMSPEQASGAKVDPRTDIFALGVVLHELLTGKRLFKKDTDIATLQAVATCKVPPPSQLRSGLDAELDRVVLKALQRNPRDRYQEAQELQLALEGWALKRKLHSGSAALEAFITELLAAEKPAPPIRTSSGSNKSRQTDPTAAARPPRPPTKSTPSAPERRKSTPAPAGPRTQALPVPQVLGRRELAVLGGAAGVALVAGIALWSVSRRATVRVRSTPSGAAVSWNLAAVAQRTPCTLPATPAGTYALELTLAGHEPYRTELEVPATGALDFAVVLKPLSKP